MAGTDRVGHRRVELYVRSELPPPARDRADTIRDRLADLLEQGLVDTVEEVEWPRRLPVDDCPGDIRDTYLRFKLWATNREVRLTPFFQTRRHFSPEQGEMTDWLVMPAFCIAVYEDGDLEAVYPNADDEGARTVVEGLDALGCENTAVSEHSTATAD